MLSRWSRLKRESESTADEAAASPDQLASPVQLASPDQLAAEAENELEQAGEVDRPARNEERITELPSLDELGPESDFQGFMKPDVDDGLRRAALKKLFSDPHFNVTDGLDVYAEDYTKLESMTPAMVAGLKHTQRLLFGDADEDKQTDAASAAGAVNQPETEVTAAGQDEFRTEHAQIREEEVVQVATGASENRGPQENAGIKPAATDDPKA